MAQGQKTGGRQAGTPNKVTGELREWITDLINENRDKIREDFKKLRPRDRLFITEKLMKYVLPTLQSVEVKDEFDRLTDEQLERLYQKIINKPE